MKKKILSFALAFIFISGLAFGAVPADFVAMGPVSMVQTPMTEATFEAGGALFPASFGATFVKQYDLNQSSLNADSSVGSPTATFTATRGATKPATFIDINGIVRLVTTSNTPRWTQGYYATNGVFATGKGLLIETASTNLFVSGQIDSNDAWADGVSADNLNYSGTARWRLDVDDGVSANTVSTDSVGTGSRSAKISISSAGANNFDMVFRNTNLLSLSDQTYTLSCWVKASANKTIAVISGEQDDDFTTYDTLDNLVTVANTWIRYETTWTHSAGAVSDATMQFRLGANGTYDIYFDSLQIEANVAASSFIPTTAASLTRNAEVLKYLTSGNRTAATETMVAEVSFGFPDSLVKVAYITDTQTKSRLIDTASGADNLNSWPNLTDSVGAGHFSLIDESWTANQRMVVGYSLQNTGNPNIAGYFNGVSDGTDNNTDWTANAWGADFYIGSKNDGTLNLDGTIHSIAFFNKALTAAEHATVDGILNP